MPAAQRQRAPCTSTAFCRTTARTAGPACGPQHTALTGHVAAERDPALARCPDACKRLTRVRGSRWTMHEAAHVVVCATAFAQAEFDRIGATVQRVPFGVDLDTFTPSRRDSRLRRELAAGAGVLLVHCGRRSREKHPQRSIDTVTALHAAGMRVRLAIAGDGPMRRTLERRARRLPVTFLGFLGRRRDVARLLASGRGARPGPARDLRPGRTRGAGLRDARGRLPVLGPGRDRRTGLRPGGDRRPCILRTSDPAPQSRRPGPPQTCRPRPRRAVRLALGGGPDGRRTASRLTGPISSVRRHGTFSTTSIRVRIGRSASWTWEAIRWSRFYALL